MLARNNREEDIADLTVAFVLEDHEEVAIDLCPRVIVFLGRDSLERDLPMVSYYSWVLKVIADVESS